MVRPSFAVLADAALPLLAAVAHNAHVWQRAMGLHKWRQQQEQESTPVPLLPRAHVSTAGVWEPSGSQ